MIPVTAELEVNGTRYTVTQDGWDGGGHWDDLDDEERRHELEGHTWYMWVQGNYSCDCNRLAFISYAYDDYPGEADENGHFPCGETVKLISLHVGEKDILAPTAAELAFDARARLSAIGLIGL